MGAFLQQYLWFDNKRAIYALDLYVTFGAKTISNKRAQSENNCLYYIIYLRLDIDRDSFL